MTAKRKEKVDLDREAEIQSAEEILLEISEDARRLKGRYARETVVPEGGE